MLLKNFFKGVREPLSAICRIMAKEVETKAKKWKTIFPKPLTINGKYGKILANKGRPLRKNNIRRSSNEINRYRTQGR